MLNRDAERCHSETFCAQVAKNSNAYSALAKDLKKERRGLLSDSIDNVGSHAVLHVNQELNHDHGVLDRVPEGPDADILDTPASLDHVLAELVGKGNYLLFPSLHLVGRISNIFDLCYLNLRNHNWGS
jgi:hypothetical protein